MIQQVVMKTDTYVDSNNETDTKSDEIILVEN
jgi:hypothetical protein